MSDLLQLLLNHGYLLILGAAFAEQMGLPIPAATVLVGMGALSRSGEFDLRLVVATAVVACLAADLIWYSLGRFHGRYVLQVICRISLEPDYCVRRTEDTFERLGLWALLPAKFIPGFNAAAIPLAGMVKTPLLRFFVFDLAGVMLWTCAYTLLGYVFSHQVEQVIMYLSTFGVSLLILIAFLVAIYILYKLDQRRKFLNGLTVARVTPEELKSKMDANEDILILDMRNHLDLALDPVRIPGAFHVLPEHVQFQPEDVTPNRNIVLYCTCPNEATSARVAMQLQRMGLKQAHPLRGGLDAWRSLQLPLERLE
jgi:membrane protein DedA with SNARE-associated domain/rhodanese-related sulfurtransferase